MVFVLLAIWLLTSIANGNHGIDLESFLVSFFLRAGSGVNYLESLIHYGLFQLRNRSEGDIFLLRGNLVVVLELINS